VLAETSRPKKAAMLQVMAQQFRIAVLDILHERGTGHWGGAASAAEIITALYFDVLRLRPDQPDFADRDRFVLSKGHASCMLYVALAERGFFPKSELSTFRQLNSRLQGHPCMWKTPGVEMSTGSLGHGLSVALGMALAARVWGQDYWTYVLLGEGDLDEGQTWEAMMAAAKFKPAGLVALIDYNKVQLDGPSEAILPLDPLPEKLRAFNWNVAPEICDGHDVLAVLESLDWVRRQREGPLAVIFRTHKGRGVSFMEDSAYWHGAVIDDETYARASGELNQALARLEQKL
jgi:transketolase